MGRLVESLSAGFCCLRRKSRIHGPDNRLEGELETAESEERVDTSAVDLPEEGLAGFHCPSCYSLCSPGSDMCSNCGAKLVTRRFGVHPRRQPYNAVIDDCQEQILASGVMEHRTSLDFLDQMGPLSHLKGPLNCLQLILQRGSSDRDVLTLIVYCLAALAFLALFALAWPEISGLIKGLAGTLGDMLGGKPLVPG